MELKEQCDVCKFWVAPDVKGQPEAQFGTCRRHSPQLKSISVATKEANIKGNAQWPRIRGNGWCGEFEPSITDKDLETLQEWAND